ncbi:MAG: hypothetical protein LBJ13_00815 [Puniceicoccales bacterium]|nr:hypothetical protein [Puniceicoccales bacterium]
MEAIIFKPEALFTNNKPKNDENKKIATKISMKTKKIRTKMRRKKMTTSNTLLTKGKSTQKPQ